MSKSKIDIISIENLRQLVAESNTYQEVLSKIGYVKNLSNTAIIRLKRKCEENQISLSHLSQNRKCTICGKLKSVSEFYFINKRPMSFCKECQKEKEKIRYNEKIQKLNNFKKTLCCKKCGEKRFYLFDFHHKNPLEKDYNISDNPRASLETLREEISKCDVLCANCHREWHYLSKENLSLSYEDWISNNDGVAELG